MKLALGLTFGGTDQTTLPLGTVTGATITITPSFVDGVASGTVDWLPDGAIAFADFVNGHYYANGAETTLLGMWEEDLNWGAWDGTLGGVDGLTAGKSPSIKDALVSTIAASGLTAVISYERGDDVAYIECYSHDYSSDSALNIFGTGTSTTASVTDFAGSIVASATDDATGLIAITITPGKLVISVNGEAVVVDSSLSAPLAIEEISLAPNGTAKIKSIAFYPPQDDADLPALSQNWLPEGAIAFADFVNGRYYANGAVTTLEAMFEENADWGDTFNPVTDVTASGLIGGAPNFVASLVADFLADGATYVIRFMAGAVSGNIGLIYADVPDFNNTWETNLPHQGSPVQISGASGSESTDAVVGAGPHGVAVTLDGTHHAASLDGGTVVTTVENLPTPPFNTIALSMFADNIVRSIAVYAPQDDADLPALSAPDWLPEGAIAYADFVNEHYFDHGVTTVAAMFGTDAVDGDTFDAGEITPATGYTGGFGGMFIGPSALSARPQFSGVLEAYANDLLGGSCYLIAYDHDTYDTQWQANLGMNASASTVSTYTLAGSVTASSAPGVAQLGINRMSFTFDATVPKLVASINGGAIFASTPDDLAADTWAALTFYIANNSIGRSITLCPVKDDADLPALSA